MSRQNVFLIITVFLVLLAFGIEAAIPISTAQLRANNLLKDVAAYSSDNPEKPGTMPEWKEAKLGDSFLINSYPDVRPSYYLVPVTEGGNIISVISIDANTGLWQWYSGIEARKSLFKTSNADAAVAALKICDAAFDFVLVSMPDKKLYWYSQWDDAGKVKEVFINTEDAQDIHTEADKEHAGLVKVEEIAVPEPSADTGRTPLTTTFDYPTSYNLTVPYHVQNDAYNCGPAALQMVFDYWGYNIDQDEIDTVAKTTPANGTWNNDLRRAGHFSSNSTVGTITGYTARSLGYGSCDCWWSYPHTYDDPDYPDRYNDLKQLISMGYPVICLMYYEPGGCGHFRVAKGYNDDLDVFIAHDPWYADPYHGADVNFEQTFFVDTLWTHTYHYGLLCCPWRVSIDAPNEVNINEQFTVTATIEYRGPHPFEGQYNPSTKMATITLGSGLSLAGGENATKNISGTFNSGSTAEIAWQVVAPNNNATGQIDIEAKGLVTGTSHSYASYSDYIGGTAWDLLSVTKTFYVRDDGGSDAYDGLAPSWNGVHGPKKTIQAAIDLAVNFSDNVIVLPGTYKGVGNKNLNFNGKSCSVEGQAGVVDTIIDCEGSGRGFSFSSGEGSTALVNGFTIKNGHSGSYGGGIYVASSSPTIKNCIIENCDADDGGGVCFYNGTATMLSCIIRNNSTFEMVHGGGGIECYTGGNPTIKNCIITGNLASLGFGGGIYCNGGSPSIKNCTITLNSGAWGGGIAVKNVNPAFWNIILWDNGVEIYLNAGAPTISYSVIEGGWTGAGSNNLDTNPELLGDFHIPGWSPCIDAGFQGLFFGVYDDIDGDVRPQGSGTDIGADELYDTDGDGLGDYSEIYTTSTWLCNPDCDNDGMSDGFEYRYGFNPWDNTDAEGNADGDCNTNYEEYVAGTDPTDPASFFAVTNITKSGSPITTTITWKSVTGKYYSVYYSDEAINGSMIWTLAEGSISASGAGENTWTDDGTKTTPAPSDCTHRVYKVGVQ